MSKEQQTKLLKPQQLTQISTKIIILAKSFSTNQR